MELLDSPTLTAVFFADSFTFSSASSVLKAFSIVASAEARMDLICSSLAAMLLSIPATIPSIPGIRSATALTIFRIALMPLGSRMANSVNPFLMSAMILSQFFQTAMPTRMAAVIPMTTAEITPIEALRVTKAILNPLIARISPGSIRSIGPTTARKTPRDAAITTIALVNIGWASVQAIMLLTNFSTLIKAFSICGNKFKPIVSKRSPIRFFNWVIGVAAASAAPPNFAVKVAMMSVIVAPSSMMIPYRERVEVSPAIALPTRRAADWRSILEPAAKSWATTRASNEPSYLPPIATNFCRASRCCSSPKLVLRCWDSITFSISSLCLA